MRTRNAFLTALTVFLGASVATRPATDRADQAVVKLVQVPFIEAEAGPVKQRPLDPGGLPIPYQDMLVFGLLEIIPPPPRKVTLAPLPEEPIELPTRSASTTEQPMSIKGQASWVRGLKVSEIHAEFRRKRRAFLAN